MQNVVTTTYHQTVTTHTFTRIDPGDYNGALDGNGTRNGFGKCKWADGSTYEGRWKDNVRWGLGTFKSCDGKIYEGEWVDDIREGDGKLRDPETNKVICGKWEKDRLNGEGTI